MLARLAVVVAAVGIASAQSVLNILAPGGPNLWWIANSDNNIVWTCHENTEFSNFTILVANSNPSLLVSPEAIIAIQPNFDCSEEVSPNQANLPVGDGYVVQFANPLNSSDIYAQSQPFEIKALGSAYPAASATPSETVASATSTGSGSSGTTGSSSSKNSAFTISPSKISLGALGLVAALFSIAL